MVKRDRSSGWKHAKLSGHNNEELVKNKLDNDSTFAESLLTRIARPSAQIVETKIGGLHEKKVSGVNGRKTKSKTDLKVKLDNGDVVNFSIKKSLGGQVYFVSAELFISTFEKQFDVKIPTNVKTAIKLFWAAADNAEEIINEHGDRTNEKFFDLQIRHNSLNATTLKSYDEKLYQSFLNWFTNNSYYIAKLSFSMGAACESSEWSEYIWYVNLLGEHDIDKIFLIEDICKACQRFAEKETYYGSSYGGTTIQLPFGFLQWHQGKLQFHHSYEKIDNLLTRYK